MVVRELLLTILKKLKAGEKTGSINIDAKIAGKITVDKTRDLSALPRDYLRGPSNCIEHVEWSTGVELIKHAKGSTTSLLPLLGLAA
ncbi:unnamed protein product [Dovyalis caffra]|uniref:Uncharacterized protein n=1 Tax=Dovyalis caffra TaxID=77055 RepID=A0AAV1SB42_9ROSI|nr:unnamed protein product [Dovyalis caffra]